MSPTSFRVARLSQVLEEQGVVRALLFAQTERQKLQKDAKARANQEEIQAEQDFLKSREETHRVCLL